MTGYVVETKGSIVPGGGGVLAAVFSFFFNTKRESPSSRKPGNLGGCHGQCDNNEYSRTFLSYVGGMCIGVVKKKRKVKKSDCRIL